MLDKFTDYLSIGRASDLLSRGRWFDPWARRYFSGTISNIDSIGYFSLTAYVSLSEKLVIISTNDIFITKKDIIEIAVKQQTNKSDVLYVQISNISSQKLYFSWLTAKQMSLVKLDNQGFSYRSPCSSDCRTDRKIPSRKWHCLYLRNRNCFL